MQQLSEECKMSPLFVDTEFVPAKLHYLTLYNRSGSPLPTVLPYVNEDITIAELTTKISRILPPVSLIHVEDEEPLEEPSKLDYFSSSIKELKFSAGKHTITGKQIVCSSDQEINLQQVLRKGREEGEGSERCDLCCIMLPHKSEVIHLSLEWKSEEATRLNIVEQVSQLYGANFGLNDLKFYRLSFKCSTEEDIISIQYIQKQASPLHQIIFQSEGIAFIGVHVTNSKLFMANLVKEVEKKPTQRFIEIFLSQLQTYRIDYDEIKHYQVKEILAILSVKEPEKKGLKIMGEIYEPNRLLEDLEPLYNNGSMLNYITAELVQQFDVFLEGVNKSPSLNTIQLRKLLEDCQRMEKSSINNLRKSKLKKGVTPLSLFLSDCQVRSNKETSFKLLYHIIHIFIRNYFTHFNSFFDDSISNRFVRGLLEQLKELPLFQGETWRKIGYELTCQEGDIITFNNFIVTSQKSDFLDVQGYASRRCKECFLKIFSETGRVVSAYSSFEMLQQVIFLPFTKFLVTQRLEDEKTIYITLSQIVEKPRKYRSNIILWVDDKISEGKEIFRNIKKHPHSIILFQLVSTAQLKQWIDSNPALLADRTCNIIMISNMRRIEEGLQNPIAGIESVRMVTSLIPKCKIILYIGHIENTKNNLKKNQIDPNSVFITNSSSKLLTKLVAECSSQPEIKQADVEKIEKQNWKEFFSFVKNQSHIPFELIKEPVVNKNGQDKLSSSSKKVGIINGVDKNKLQPPAENCQLSAIEQKLEVAQKKANKDNPSSMIYVEKEHLVKEWIKLNLKGEKKKSMK